MHCIWEEMFHFLIRVVQLRWMELMTGLISTLSNNTKWTISFLFSVLSAGTVQTLDDAGGVAKDQGKAGCPSNHGDHGEPQVGHVLRGKPPITNTQHVGHGLEQ